MGTKTIQKQANGSDDEMLDPSREIPFRYGVDALERDTCVLKDSHLQTHKSTNQLIRAYEMRTVESSWGVVSIQSID